VGYRIVENAEQPVLASGPGARSRVLAAASTGAEHMSVVERWLAPGAEVPLHQHPEGVEEVIWVRRGTAEFRLGDETAVVGPDTTVIVPPGLRHGFAAVGDEELHLFARWSAAAPLAAWEDGREEVEVPGAAA
jgi:quercetin dioxygenase-like cupin family protein